MTSAAQIFRTTLVAGPKAGMLLPFPLAPAGDGGVGRRVAATRRLIPPAHTFEGRRPTATPDARNRASALSIREGRMTNLTNLARRAQP